MPCIILAVALPQALMVLMLLCALSRGLSGPGVTTGSATPLLTVRVRALIKFLTTPKKHPGAGVTTSNDIGEKAK